MYRGPNNQPTYDYVIVGSGAGGGPLAGNLAKAGQKVLLLEAGSDYEDYNYQVPAFHVATNAGKRNGTREYIRSVQAKFPQRSYPVFWHLRHAATAQTLRCRAA